VIVVLTDVASIGELAAGPDGQALLRPGWLADGEDRRRFRVGVRHVAQLLASDALGPVADTVSIDDIGTPLGRLGAMADDELDRWLIQHPGPVRHPTSSVPMAQSGAPVDLTGALVGYDEVYLADASVLPHLPNANPMLAVLAVAERLAAGLTR
jgi:choline dehydrogenase-like flavoprotein